MLDLALIGVDFQCEFRDLIAHDEYLIGDIDELSVEYFMQIMIDYPWNHVRYLLHHLLALYWQISSNRRPRILILFLKAEAHFLPILLFNTRQLIDITPNATYKQLVLGNLLY